MGFLQYQNLTVLPFAMNETSWTNCVLTSLIRLKAILVSRQKKSKVAFCGAPGVVPSGNWDCFLFKLFESRGEREETFITVWYNLLKELCTNVKPWLYLCLIFKSARNYKDMALGSDLKAKFEIQILKGPLITRCLKTSWDLPSEGWILGISVITETIFSNPNGCDGVDFEWSLVHLQDECGGGEGAPLFSRISK